MPKVYSLDHPLGSAQLKAKWANVHIRRLDLARRLASRDPQLTLVRQNDLNLPGVPEIPLAEGASIYAVSIDPAMERHWGLVIGDILTNLRASLDHVAWALAEWHCRQTSTILTDRDQRRVLFPLRWTPIRPSDASIGGLNWNDLQFMPSNAHAIIEKFQPYNRSKWPELKLLGVLNELVSEDKHRVVTPVFREARFRLLQGDRFMRASLNQPHAYFFVVTDSQRDHLEPQVSFDVVLNVPSLAPDYFRVSDFRRIYQIIRYDMIPAFAGCFD